MYLHYHVKSTFNHSTLSSIASNTVIKNVKINIDCSQHYQKLKVNVILFILSKLVSDRVVRPI